MIREFVSNLALSALVVTSSLGIASSAQSQAIYTATPRNTPSVDLRTSGRDIMLMYETGNEIFPGIVAEEDYDGNMVYVTRQITDDGNVVYYSRINNDRDFILRYNATRNSIGRTDVYSKTCSTGYLKARVTMLTDRGQYLSTPQVTQVETNDMYSGIRALICN